MDRRRRLLLLGSTALAPPAPSGPIGVPTLIATASAANGTAASLTLNVTTTIPAGTTVYVGQCVTTAITVDAVTDSKGNTWTALAPTGGGINIGGAWCVLTTPLVSGDTITAPFANTNGRKFAWAYAVTGIAGFDQVGPGVSDVSGSSDNPTITTSALAQANEILFFATFGQAMNDTSWIEDANSTTLSQIQITADARRLVVSYRIVSAATAVVYDPQLTAAMTWAQNYVAFKGAI